MTVTILPVIRHKLLVISISSCKILSRNDIPTFCEEMLGNSTLYHHRDSLDDIDSSFLLNITSLQTRSPCLDLMKRYLCYYYHPVCNTETGDVVEFCTSNCEVLNEDSSCSDLVIDVTRELETVGQEFPDIECLMVDSDSETDEMCLDISNGKIRSQHHCVYEFTLHLSTG